jgi:hypothetical protein
MFIPIETLVILTAAIMTMLCSIVHIISYYHQALRAEKRFIKHWKNLAENYMEVIINKF